MSTPAKRRILFVDDEDGVLIVLKAFIQRVAEGWEGEFVKSGDAALQALTRRPFDVVVSDMRMPGISGTQLLNEVLRRYPWVIRIILSGHADEHTVQESVGIAHQWVAKPFDLQKFKALLDRIAASAGRMECQGLRELVGRMGHLPSFPQLYFDILRALQSSTCSAQTIADIVKRDPALSVKMLQLVNSAFFGMAREIANTTEAVQLLGVSRIRSLALTHHILSTFSQAALEGISLDEVWAHGLRTATWAQQLVSWQGGGRSDQDLAFTGGMLHDIGHLLFAVNLAEPSREILTLARERPCSLYEAEKTVLHNTHATVAAYLLGIWGLPIPLVETVALHHEPSASANRTFDALGAVHVASFWSYGQSRIGRTIPAVPLDMTYLREVGVHGKIEAWRAKLIGT